ncbi:hypothetical protein Tco_1057679 [Tanacetum coccineum]|uniref:Uncharacterized protein n=1 Tax=Tanacetum coccineum TaxID=301880 RepID=A0ABQ5H7W0_9ASTR
MVDAYTWNSTIWRLPPPIRDDWLSSRVGKMTLRMRCIESVRVDVSRSSWKSELGNMQTEIALLKSKNKIGEKERYLIHDLGNIEHHDMVERRLHASYGWNKRFYMEMVRIGAFPKPPSADEGTERPRKKSKKSSFDGTEGPSEPRGPPSDSQ